MKSKVVVILAGVASLHLIALGTLGLSGGCKSLFGSGDEPAPAPVSSELPPAEVTPPASEVAPFIETKVSPLTHTVKSGDSLWKIAKMYGVTTQSLATVNKMSTSTPLKTGTVLTIPPGGKLISGNAASKKTSHHETATASKAAAAFAASSKKASTTEGGTYIVKSGDSLWKIAVKHNLKTDALAKANNLDPKKALKVGQKLVIPQTGKATAVAASKAKKSDDKKAHSKETVKAKTKTKSTAPVSAETDTAAAAPAAPNVPVSKTEAKGKDALDSLNNSTETTDDLLEDIANDSAGAKAAPASTEAKPVTSGAHETVEINEETTIQNIANQYGVKVEDLKKVNQNIPSSGKLTPGMIIALP